MTKAPAFQFYIKDWLSDPQLKMASFSTKGIWIDVLCYMWGASDKGILKGTKEQLSRLIGSNGIEFDRFLDEAKILSFCDISVTDNEIITLCNRRMYRDEKDRKNNSLRQQRFRDKQSSNEGITPLSPSPSPSPKKKTKQKKKILVNPEAENIYSHYLEKIDPLQKSKSRSVKNISGYLNEYPEQELISAIDNYFNRCRNKRTTTSERSGKLLWN